LAQRYDLPYLARSAELGFLKDLKSTEEVMMIGMLKELVRFLYKSMPPENVNLRSALSAYAAKEFRSDTEAFAKVMQESFHISPEFGYEVALALTIPAKRRGR